MKINGKFIAYDHKNSVNITGQNYQMKLKVEKGIDEFVNKFDFLNI